MQSMSTAGTWSVHPLIPGENLPPLGRSLFDQLVADDAGRYDLPFPFTALMQHIAERAKCRTANWSECFRSVLIPLGRSLQRTAGGQESFRFPRVIYAADEDIGTETGAPLLKDRFYVAYQEHAQVLEVISYNEDAGRFEFQVVKNYGMNQTPSVFYANRALCVACHQNQAPIFSRQVWDETNANPVVRARLQAAHADVHGVQIERGVDIPQFIDNATDRGNLLAPYQLLWLQGCGSATPAAIRCRAALMVAGLQLRLSNESGFERASERMVRDFNTPTQAAWQQHWPEGLLIPDADVPNRDPMRAVAEGQPQFVHARFDPLNPRRHSERWQWQIDRYRAVRAVSDSLSQADVSALDNFLFSRESNSARTHRASCDVVHTKLDDGTERLSIRCKGGQGDTLPDATGSLIRSPNGSITGNLDTLRLEGDERLGNVTLVGQETAGSYRLDPRRGAMHLRRYNGNAIASITLRLAPTAPGQAEIELEERDDFAVVSRTVDELAAGLPDLFADRPFRRSETLSALFATIGLNTSTVCCENTNRLPRPAVETTPPAVRLGAGEPLEPFFRHCARCHLSNEHFPPNFLTGSRDRVTANVQHCAQRILYRLSMWSTADAERPKSPMPPVLAARSSHGTDKAWQRSEDLAQLKRIARSLAGAAIRGNALAQPYESLPACLPGPG